MSLEMYLDDAKTVPFLQENVFTALTTVHNLDGLIASQVQTVYKYDGAVYTVLTQGVGYTLIGTVLTLTDVLTIGQHIVVMPTNKINLIFTGIEGSSKTKTQKLIFYKGDTTTVYDAMNMYSENLMTTSIDLTDTILGGFSSFIVDIGMTIYRSNSVVNPVTGIGFATNLDLSLVNLEDCAIIMNNQYIGDVWATDYINTIVMPAGTTFPANNTTDVIHIVSTGDLRFATGVAGDLAPTTYTRCLSLPTLNMANRTAYVWMKETVIIPATTVEMPNMPFKLIGQSYTE